MDQEAAFDMFKKCAVEVLQVPPDKVTIRPDTPAGS